QISKVWELLLTLGAGTGLVYILRWYWWRVNAWSEVAAMGSALLTSVVLRQVFDPATPRGFALNLILTTAVTTVVWLAVTFATRPEAEETLDSFYRKVRPAGAGWGPVARRTGLAPPAGEIAHNFGLWILGITFVYSIMFAAGGVIFHLQRQALLFGVILIVSGTLLVAGLLREKA
ncbi:MAG TPA: sodium:proline symporter, partial [Thermoanaerobaculia bacterium]|nr:sodium:proline symporter [Thermoanaerobaculia bacterium]